MYANVGLDMKISVWTPALTLLDLLPEFESNLYASRIIYLCCEGGKIFPDEFYPLEAYMGILLLTGVDTWVFVFWSLFWYITTVKGYKIWYNAPTLDWSFNQVSAKILSLGVAIYYEWLTRYPQLVGSIPDSIYGTVDKSYSKTT